MSLLLSPARFLDALEADLVAAGYSFDDVPERLPWRALFAFLDHLPADSALARAREPEKAEWAAHGPTPFLLAAMGHRLDVLAWQQTKDGQKGRKKPKPWPTPWSDPDKDVQRIGRGAIPASEWDDFWGDGT